ncbi:helix-turn-helix domain-containing protein [Microbacterium sp. 2216-1]|uniref:helix-turn-helix domain-containing protein n=1 Tax=Microbacterium sp. 2216-1 TaxID=3390053 RepID=UPI003976A0F0
MQPTPALSAECVRLASVFRWGGKPTLAAKQAGRIRALYASGTTVSELAEDFKVSRPTIYRALEPSA